MADEPVGAAQLIRGLRWRLAELGTRHRPWLWVAVPALLLCAALALIRHPSSAFAANARTSVLTVEPTCGHQMVWDLPLGTVTRNASDKAPPPPLEHDAGGAAAAKLPAASASAATTENAPMSITAQLWAGARARIERVGDGGLTIRFDRSPNFAPCVSTRSVVHLDVGKVDGSGLGTSHELPANGSVIVTLVYRSASGSQRSAVDASDSDKPLEFVLPLEGRVVLGAALQQGAGWHDAGAAALLDRADIAVRSRAALTGHSIVLVDEKVDAGSVIDTAPCFEHGPTLFWDGLHPWSGPTPQSQLAQACAAGLGAPAVGFVRTHREGGMEAQVHLQSHRLAITAHQGEPRMLGITLWRALLNSPFAQAVAALIVLVGSGTNAMEALRRFGRWVSLPRAMQRGRSRRDGNRLRSTRSKP